MVNSDPSIALLQLVALSLPAFAILLQLVVESNFPYTKEAVPVTTVGLGFFLLAGLIILVEILLTNDSVFLRSVVIILGLGLISMLVGTGLIGLQTHQEQKREEELVGDSRVDHEGDDDSRELP